MHCCLNDVISKHTRKFRLMATDSVSGFMLEAIVDSSLVLYGRCQILHCSFAVASSAGECYLLITDLINDLVSIH